MAGLLGGASAIIARNRHILASRLNAGATVTTPREGRGFFAESVRGVTGLFEKNAVRNRDAIRRDARIINQIDYAPGYFRQGIAADFAAPVDPNNSVLSP